VPQGNAREALLRVADQLCAELAEGGEEEPPHPHPPLAGGLACGRLGSLSPEDESLVAAILRDLAKVVTAVGAERRKSAPQSEVDAALDRAELVIRGELAGGNAEQLPALMPSFVFLVTLPIVKQDEALYLSRRTSELIERALGS
jgi:hypothetical protein